MQQLSLVHHRDGLAEDDRLVHVVGHKHDGGAEAVLYGEQILLRLGADDRVERAEGLVHQEDVRLGGERASDADALLLAARELVRHPVAERGGIEREEIEQLVDAGGDALLAPVEQRRDRGDVLAHGAVRKQSVALDGVADVPAQFVGRQLADVLAVDEHTARTRLDEAVDHAQQRGLARAGGADDGGNGARANGQRDGVDDRGRAVRLGEVSSSIIVVEISRRDVRPMRPV